MCACSSRPTCPSCEFAIDRTKASEMGLTERDVANSVLLSLSGSGQVQPGLLAQPAASASNTSSTSACRSTGWIRWRRSTPIPINASQPGEGDVQLLANLATVTRTQRPAGHFALQRHAGHRRLRRRERARPGRRAAATSSR